MALQKVRHGLRLGPPRLIELSLHVVARPQTRNQQRDPRFNDAEGFRVIAIFIMYFK